MRESKGISRFIVSFIGGAFRREAIVKGQRESKRMITNVQRLALIAILVLPALAFGLLQITDAKNGKAPNAKAGAAHRALPQNQAGRTYAPTHQAVISYAPINVAEASREEALAPALPPVAEIKSINPPAAPPERNFGVPIVAGEQRSPQAPPASATGPSAGPTKTIPGEFLTATSIPPDTMGAVGTTHVVTVTNDRMRIQTRDGVQVSRVTLSSFWTGVALEGGAAVSAFDPKILYDRFNNRWIFVASANAQTLSSAVLFAVSQTSDPTGTWNRFSIDADPAATAGGGLWIDYPSLGFNKNWITINENVFGYGSVSGYQRADIYAIDKQAAYSNTLGTVSSFKGLFSTCLASGTQETELGCGFTMAPAITEDNTTNTEYLIEDWDSTAAQLRMSKLTGTAAAPVLTVATQFPQSTLAWRFDAARIGTTGGYAPQRQQSANLVSGTRIMTNDSRIQNAVLRNGTLWTAHTVMLPTVPLPAGTGISAANPDNHSGIQWWAIDPTQETGVSNPTSVLQRARIEDPTADNCHNGSAGTVAAAPCNNSTLNQHGTFLAFPSISVNQSNDVLIGFTQFSAFTYPSSAYAMRLAADPINTTRDPVVFHPGQSNYNIGAGTSNTTSRQNRWGDYSAAQTDPLNDTDFWTVQEYSGIYRSDFLGAFAAPWETWWAQVKPSTVAPSTAGNLIISEFRLRGPIGTRDEFVEVYNPGTTPVVVNVTDNSDGWALVFSTSAGVISGVAVIPNGTVIPAKGHFLFADNPDVASVVATPNIYSLSTYPGETNPSTLVRGSDSDTGWAFDLADNGGLALFKSNLAANWTAPNRMDSVGFSGVPAGLFKEGAGIPAMTTQPTTNWSYHRNLSSGQPKDTNTNENDFVFVDVAATSPSAGVQRLGAPGPENLDGPIHNQTGAMALQKFDGAAAAGTAPNFVYDPTPVTNGTSGTITVRRRLVNGTGAPISRVRMRFVDITTFPQPVGTADLRVLNSTNVTVETPPAQALGGGLNTTVAPAIVTFAAPIANGGEIPIDFVFGVNQVGCFHFVVNVEALPGGANEVFGFAGTAGGGACGPTAAPGIIGGNVVTPEGAPLAGVTMRLAGARSATAITDAGGNYTFRNVDTEQFYTVTPARVNYRFNPGNRSFSLIGNKTDAVFTAIPETVIAGTAIDTPEFFVRQHYVDFLGREPDESGFNFWSSQISSCGVDADCLERKRINVSAAYFLSVEFQETGGLVDGLYRASYGRAPRYAEFMPDAAAMAQNIVVGRSDWQTQLVANKRTFIDAWVQRADFRAAFDGLTNGAYVDKLIIQTGVSLSAGERNALMSSLSSGASRAEVLRQIAENEGFLSGKRNQAFVMMEYFGYLRRDPDESGYQFWLNKLNQFDGNFERAEMVKAFINSGEYRSRFAR